MWVLQGTQTHKRKTRKVVDQETPIRLAGTHGPSTVRDPQPLLSQVLATGVCPATATPRSHPRLIETKSPFQVSFVRVWVWASYSSPSRPLLRSPPRTPHPGNLPHVPGHRTVSLESRPSPPHPRRSPVARPVSGVQSRRLRPVSTRPVQVTPTHPDPFSRPPRRTPRHPPRTSRGSSSGGLKYFCGDRSCPTIRRPPRLPP